MAAPDAFAAAQPVGKARDMPNDPTMEASQHFGLAIIFGPLNAARSLGSFAAFLTAGAFVEGLGMGSGIVLECLPFQQPL